MPAEIVSKIRKANEYSNLGAVEYNADSLFNQAKSIWPDLQLDNQSEIEIYTIWTELPPTVAGFLHPAVGFGAEFKVEQTSFAPKSGEALVAAMEEHGLADIFGYPEFDKLALAYIGSGEEGLDQAISDVTAGAYSTFADFSGEGYASSMEQIRGIAEYGAEQALMRHPSLSDGLPYEDSPRLTDGYEAAESFLYATAGTGGYKDQYFGSIMEYAALTNWFDVYQPSTGIESMDDLLSGERFGGGIGGVAVSDGMLSGLTGGGGLNFATQNMAATDRTAFMLEPQIINGAPYNNHAWETPTLRLDEITEINFLDEHGLIDGLPTTSYGPAVVLGYDNPANGTSAASQIESRWITKSQAHNDMMTFLEDHTAKVSSSMAIVVNRQFLQKRQRTSKLEAKNFSALGAETPTVTAETTEGLNVVGMMDVMIAEVREDLSFLSPPGEDY